MSESVAQSPGRVCVIGAGIAGLVTAKVLAEDGFEVTVYEKETALGGTWNASRTYPGLRANNSKYTYAFSDYAYPKDAAKHPYAEQIRGYLESYANHFSIRRRIRFNTEVRNLARDAADPAVFAVTASDRESGAESTERYEFVAVCNGVFHEPNVPEIPGMVDFAGQIVPACDVTQATYDRAQRPVIAGGGKTALDCASWAAKLDLDPTLVLRHPHWMTPRYLFGLIPADFLVVSRLSGSLLRYHTLRGWERFLHTSGKWFVDAWWQTLSFIFPRLIGMPPELTPPTLPVELERVGVGGEFFTHLNDGQVRAEIGEIVEFRRDTVVLDNGEELATDLVVFATGWRQNTTFIDPALRAEIVDDDGRFLLYRHILPPRVPHLGFIGYASSFAAQMTAEIGAHWLSESFLKGFDLPSPAEMDEAIDAVHAWAREVMPSRREGYFVGAYMTNYINDLIEDMRLPVNRTSNFVTEYLGPCFASRYAGLTEERRVRRAAQGSGTRTPFYIGPKHAALAIVVASVGYALL